MIKVEKRFGMSQQIVGSCSLQRVAGDRWGLRAVATLSILDLEAGQRCERKEGMRLFIIDAVGSSDKHSGIL